MKALLLSALLLSADALVVAVTHAAGRMGVSVIGQLREQVSPSQTLQLRAVVRNEEEASRLRLDMCGAVLRNGTLFPLLDLQKDLNIELCVVPDDADEQQALGKAFEGVDVAVLLSAAHADFMSATPAAAKRDEALLSAGGLDADGQPADGIETGKQYMVRASSEYLAAVAESGGSGVNVRVPPVAGAAANRRLGTEVAAAASASGMRHVVLRSSMGVAALRAVSEPSGGEEAVDGAAELAPEAVTRMGGPAAIAAQADAEAALRTRCGQRGVSYTVLRLGALVDSSGGAWHVHTHAHPIGLAIGAWLRPSAASCAVPHAQGASPLSVGPHTHCHELARARASRAGAMVLCREVWYARAELPPRSPSARRLAAPPAAAASPAPLP